MKMQVTGCMLKKDRKREMERKKLQILIVFVESYKLGNDLLFSPFLFYNLIKRIVLREGKVEERRGMSPWQMRDLILPPIFSL